MCIDKSDCGGDCGKNKLIQTCKRCGHDGIPSLRHHGLGWCRTCEDHIDIMETLNRLLIVLHKLTEKEDEDIF